MIPNRCLPWFVIALFKGMPGTWKSRHKLVFCWMILMQTIVPGRKTIKEMSRWSPIHISEWHFRLRQDKPETMGREIIEPQEIC